eukprot:TRINITY_DN8871_c0_g1_i1.p1 TRINITY_DN8871_c0_g1~~TRINITY_DN8871_c0_g1_i1.p1  ORF type:complete len:1217 (+),score=230.09 TRINITY_DN8871_c0_g1_i1:122-3772(+)
MEQDSGGDAGWGCALRRIKTLSQHAHCATLLVEGMADGRLYALRRMEISNVSSRVRREVAAEVRHLGSLRHVFILSCYGSFEEKAHVNILTDYPDCGGVRALLPSASTDTVLEWITQLALALDHSHTSGILHRDLCVDALFVTAKGSLKLGDYGVASLLSHPSHKEAIEHTSPFHTAPEVRVGLPYTAASDVWAYGIVCKALLEGRHVERDLRDLTLLLDAMVSPDPRCRPSLSDVVASPAIAARSSGFSLVLRSELSAFMSQQSRDDRRSGCVTMQRALPPPSSSAPAPRPDDRQRTAYHTPQPDVRKASGADTAPAPRDATPSDESCNRRVSPAASAVIAHPARDTLQHHQPLPSRAHAPAGAEPSCGGQHRLYGTGRRPDYEPVATPDRAPASRARTPRTGSPAARAAGYDDNTPSVKDMSSHASVSSTHRHQHADDASEGSSFRSSGAHAYGTTTPEAGQHRLKGERDRRPQMPTPQRAPLEAVEPLADGRSTGGVNHHAAATPEPKATGCEDEKENAEAAHRSRIVLCTEQSAQPRGGSGSSSASTPRQGKWCDLPSYMPQAERERPSAQLRQPPPPPAYTGPREVAPRPREDGEPMRRAPPPPRPSPSSSRDPPAHHDPVVHTPPAPRHAAAARQDERAGFETLTLADLRVRPAAGTPGSAVRPAQAPVATREIEREYPPASVTTQGSHSAPPASEARRAPAGRDVKPMPAAAPERKQSLAELRAARVKQRSRSRGVRDDGTGMWLRDAKERLQGLTDMLAVMPGGAARPEAADSPQRPRVVEATPPNPPNPPKAAPPVEERDSPVRAPPPPPASAPTAQRRTGSVNTRAPPAARKPAATARAPAGTAVSRSMSSVAKDRRVEERRRREEREERRAKEAEQRRAAEAKYRQNMKSVKSRINTASGMLQNEAFAKNARGNHKDIIVIAANDDADDALRARGSARRTRGHGDEANPASGVQVRAAEAAKEEDAVERRARQETARAEARNAIRESRKQHLAEQKQKQKQKQGVRAQEWEFELYEPTKPMRKHPVPEQLPLDQPAPTLLNESLDDCPEPSSPPLPQQQCSLAPRPQGPPAPPPPQPQAQAQAYHHMDEATLSPAPMKRKDTALQPAQHVHHTQAYPTYDPTYDAPPPEPSTSMGMKVTSKIDGLRDALCEQLGSALFAEKYAAVKHSPAEQTTLFDAGEVDGGTARVAERMLYQLVELEDLVGA